MQQKPLAAGLVKVFFYSFNGSTINSTKYKRLVFFSFFHTQTTAIKILKPT